MTDTLGADIGSAAINAERFTEGVLSGIAATQTSLTPDQDRRWRLDWGADYVVDQFLTGYQQTITDGMRGWQHTAAELWEAISAPLETYDKVSAAVDAAYDAITDPAMAEQFTRAGRVLGEAAAGWLNESVDSPPQFARRCGELAGRVVLEAIETVATAGAKKALDLTSIANRVAARLPQRMRRPLRLEAGGSSSGKRGNADRGTADRGTDKKDLADLPQAEFDRELDKALGGTPFTDPRGTGSLSGREWTHDKREERQHESASLPPEAEEKRAGRVHDAASRSQAAARAFADALDTLDDAFSRHIHAALRHQKPRFREKLQRLSHLRGQLIDVAQAVRRENLRSGAHQPYRIRDAATLRQVADNYAEARGHAKAYREVLTDAWTRTYDDPAVRDTLLDRAMPHLRVQLAALGDDEHKRRDELRALLRVATHDRRALWADVPLRQKLVKEAFGLEWERGKAPRTDVVKPGGKPGTAALEGEHLFRQTDIPHLALRPEWLTPTTRRINGTINEAIRRIEREQLQGFVRTDPNANELAEDFLTANKDMIRRVNRGESPEKVIAADREAERAEAEPRPVDPVGAR